MDVKKVSLEILWRTPREWQRLWRRCGGNGHQGASCVTAHERCRLAGNMRRQRLRQRMSQAKGHEETQPNEPKKTRFAGHPNTGRPFAARTCGLLLKKERRAYTRSVRGQPMGLLVERDRALHSQQRRHVLRSIEPKPSSPAGRRTASLQQTCIYSVGFSTACMALRCSAACRAPYRHRPLAAVCPARETKGRAPAP